MSAYLVWKSYQRRAEVLAHKLSAEIIYLPHLFRRKWQRPFDYIYKFFCSIFALLKRKPVMVHIQSPPLFTALPALLLGIPYILDTHNGVWQRFWGRLPLSGLILDRSKAILVHNSEIEKIARKQYQSDKYIVLRDPVGKIEWPVERVPGQIVFVCSFDPGEPIDAIVKVVEQMRDYKFYITADPCKVTPEQRRRLMASSNLTLTGYLSTQKYQEMLCSSQAVVVLEEGEGTQPSGACEALSSDTPLVLSRSTLTESLFGDWALLVDNDSEDIERGIRATEGMCLDLESERSAWNAEVDRGLRELEQVIGQDEETPNKQYN